MTSRPQHTKSCCDAEGLAAFVDGERSADDAAVVREHLRTCASCLAEVSSLMSMNQALLGLADEKAPGAFWDRIATRLGMADQPQPRHVVSRRMVIGAGVGVAVAVAAAVAVVALGPFRQNVVTASVQDFITYRDKGWTVDLVSNDGRALAAWAQSRVAFAVPEPKERFGGLEVGGIRLCWLLNRRLLGLTYGRGDDRAVVYIMEAQGLALPATDRELTNGQRASVQHVKGHGVAVWTEKDLVFVVVAADRAFEKWIKTAALDLGRKSASARTSDPPSDA